MKTVTQGTCVLQSNLLRDISCPDGWLATPTIDVRFHTLLLQQVMAPAIEAATTEKTLFLLFTSKVYATSLRPSFISY